MLQRSWLHYQKILTEQHLDDWVPSGEQFLWWQYWEHPLLLCLFTRNVSDNNVQVKLQYLRIKPDLLQGNDLSSLLVLGFINSSVGSFSDLLNCQELVLDFGCKDIQIITKQTKQLLWILTVTHGVTVGETKQKEYPNHIENTVKEKREREENKRETRGRTRKNQGKEDKAETCGKKLGAWSQRKRWSGRLNRFLPDRSWLPLSFFIFLITKETK